MWTSAPGSGTEGLLARWRRPRSEASRFFPAGKLLHVAAAPLSALVVALAWVSHIAADLTNISRVAALWPLRWGHFPFGVRKAASPRLRRRRTSGSVSCS